MREKKLTPAVVERIQKLQFITENIMVGELKHIAKITGYTEDMVYKVIRSERSNPLIIDATYNFIQNRMNMVASAQKQFSRKQD